MLSKQTLKLIKKNPALLWINPFPGRDNISIVSMALRSSSFTNLCGPHLNRPQKVELSKRVFIALLPQ